MICSDAEYFLERARHSRALARYYYNLHWYILLVLEGKRRGLL